MRDDRPRRGDRELLACDLEDECSERIERRELVDPSPGAEVRSRVDQSREHGIRVAQELSRIGIGKGGPLAGSGLNDALGHRTFIPPSTTTSISVTYKLSSEARKRSRRSRSRRGACPSSLSCQECVQHGDSSISYQGYVDAADCRRLLGHSKVEAEQS